jgi:hypothetical protein
MSKNTKPLRISPSKLELVLACPAAPKLSSPFPFSDNEHAQRGRSLHEAMALLMDVGDSAMETIEEEYSPADVTAIKAAFSIVKELEPEGHYEKFVEVKLDLAWLGMPEGTPDVAYYHPASGTVIVIDWKFGRGMITAPEENPQLISYGIALSRKLEAEGKEVTQLFTVIIQPANTHLESFRSGTIPRASFPEWEAKIIAAVSEARSENPIPCAGWHCKKLYCEAAKHPGTCPAFDAWESKKAEELKASKEAAVEQAVSGLSPVLVEPGEPFAGPMVVISEEAVARAEGYREQALAFTITDKASADAAGLFLNEVTKFEGLVETNRKMVDAPVRDLLTRIKEAASKALLPLGEAKVKLKERLDEWKKAENERLQREHEEALKKQREAQEAARKAEEEAAKAKTKAAKEQAEKKAALMKAQAAEASQQAKEAPAKVGPIAGTKEVPKIGYDVLDFAAMPDAYKVTDDKALLAAIKSKGWDKEGKSPAWLKVTVTMSTSSTGRK